METRKKIAGRPRSVRIAVPALIIAVIVGTLIYFERIEVLYVLSTFALIALLLAVGFSDLESVGKPAEAEPKPGEHG